ncbi:FkbM family methyltransferase [Mastigocladus laminosus UU774]|nr:FkbM family methyltransferase [Mastigocladus laminosus UU774]
MSNNTFKILAMISMAVVYGIKNKLLKLSCKDIQYRNFHSQYGEDRFIFKSIKLPQKGVFIDVGAGHPTYLSNTYFFEKNGWDGICIDANISQVELLKRERKNVEWAAVSEEEGEIEFYQSFSPEFSTSVKQTEYPAIMNNFFNKDAIKVPSFRLETILQKYDIDVIDILDIDVEGSELEVCKTFDYQKYKPKVVVIEYYTFGIGDNSNKIKEYFANLPYRLVHTTCSNLIFVHQL